MNIFSCWICHQCQNELGFLVDECVYCEVYEYKDFSFNPYIHELLEYWSEQTMTPQEELFKELFNHETLLVKDMDALTLRAHREELAKIAFEARARLSAADNEEKQRKPKKEDKGFQRSINGDDVTSDVINTVKDRQKRLTKQEKIIEGLMKLPGFDRKLAEETLTAGALKGRLDKIKPSEEKAEEKIEEVKIPVFNPFAKKES